MYLSADLFILLHVLMQEHNYVEPNTNCIPSQPPPPTLMTNHTGLAQLFLSPTDCEPVSGWGSQGVPLGSPRALGVSVATGAL